MWTTAYLSLGSNLGDRARSIEAALQLLGAADLTVVRRSSLYETEPRDYADQPWFLNMVAEIETTLPSDGLLARVREVESLLGRQRAIDKGPRTVDIDILTFGDSVVASPDLQIPHPRMAQRRFVLEPLAELVPELPLGPEGTTVRELLPLLTDQAVRKFENV
jgi:2-amino-4-hydroxy-6-hydroxymethyldihydropteridine diphosphokinase